MYLNKSLVFGTTHTTIGVSDICLFSLKQPLGDSICDILCVSCNINRYLFCFSYSSGSPNVTRERTLTSRERERDCVVSECLSHTEQSCCSSSHAVLFCCGTALTDGGIALTVWSLSASLSTALTDGGSPEGPEVRRSPGSEEGHVS